MRVEELAVVAHIDVQRQTMAHLAIEIDQMRIDVAEQRRLWLESKRDCQPSTEWLDVTTSSMFAPERLNPSQQPALAAGPFQGRVEGGCYQINVVMPAPNCARSCLPY